MSPTPDTHLVKLSVEVLSTQNIISSGDRVFTKVIKLKWGHKGEVRGEICTQRHSEGIQCEDTWRKWPSTSQTEKPGTNPFLTALQKNYACWQLDLGLPPPPELLENKFLMLMPPSLWYFVTEALTAELQTKCCCGCRGLRSRVLLYSWVEYKLVQPLWKTVWHHLEMSIWGPNNSTPRYVFLDYCCWIELSRMMEMCQKWCCPILLLSANSTGNTMWLLYTWNVVNTTKRLHF